MAKKLDIIIPHWKEDEWLMKPMFDILKLQRNVNFADFGVIIVLDGEDIVLSEEFKKYIADCPFDVRSVPTVHGGISAARNAGLHASRAEWIMWCDSDDAFCSTIALSTFFRYAEDDKALVTCAFFEEAPSLEDGHIVYLWHAGKDYIFVHGKMFRRKWLLDNNVQFNPDLRLHEDTYCIAIAKSLLNDKDLPNRKKDTVYIKDPLYLWQYNKKSVSRSYRNFVLETYDDLIKKNVALTKEFLRRGMFVQAKGIVCRTITDAYLRLNCKSWNTDENKDLIKDAEDCVSYFLKTFDYIFKGSGDTVIMAGLNDLKKRLIENNDFDEEAVPPLYEWVESLRK